MPGGPGGFHGQFLDDDVDVMMTFCLFLFCFCGSLQVKDGSLDEYSAKLSTLEREQKRMVKELETLHNQASKLREMERENKELQHATVIERKTLAAIR